MKTPSNNIMKGEGACALPFLFKKSVLLLGMLMLVLLAIPPIKALAANEYTIGDMVFEIDGVHILSLVIMMRQRY